MILLHKIFASWLFDSLLWLVNVWGWLWLLTDLVGHIIPTNQRCIDAIIGTILALSVYKLPNKTLRAMLTCLQHAILVWAVAYTGCGVFSSPWCSTDSSNTRKRQAGREGDVALGLTNDLDTAVWISFTSIAASKCTSLFLTHPYGNRGAGADTKTAHR